MLSASPFVPLLAKLLQIVVPALEEEEEEKDRKKKLCVLGYFDVCILKSWGVFRGFL